MNESNITTKVIDFEVLVPIGSRKEVAVFFDVKEGVVISSQLESMLYGQNVYDRNHKPLLSLEFVRSLTGTDELVDQVAFDATGMTRLDKAWKAAAVCSAAAMAGSFEAITKLSTLNDLSDKTVEDLETEAVNVYEIFQAIESVYIAMRTLHVMNANGLISNLRISFRKV